MTAFQEEMIPLDMAVDMEVETTTASSTSNHQAFIVISDKEFDSTIVEWLKRKDDLSDSEMDTVDENCCHTQAISRNASLEPATHDDMTYDAIVALDTEDRLNDFAMRDLLPHDGYDFTWTNDRTVFTGKRENFTATPGPTLTMTDATKPTDIFYNMINMDFIDQLCTETNRYAEQKITMLKNQNRFVPTSRLCRWTPTDRDEMISFFALIILQGLFPLPEEEAYFSFNSFGTMPYFRKIMSYNRYLLLKSLLQFVDNDSITERTKLSKIQPVIDYFNDRFSTLYYPSQEIVIDESLLKPGRLGFAQKISKVVQKEFKTYELCESSTGYLWKFFVYAGKENTKTTTNDDVDNATVKIVYDLVEPLLHRGHTLIIDNFYNSPLLARCLKRQQTDCFGTLRLNREFVPDALKTLTKSYLQPGEVVATYCSDLSICVWRDANIVSLISTYHAHQVGNRRNNKLTYKPTIVLDYNKSMNGVDRKDQFLSAHPVERTKDKVLYKKLFQKLFNTAIFNSFIIFKSKHNITYRKFRITLAENLLKIHRQIDLAVEQRIITRPAITTTQSAIKSEKTKKSRRKSGTTDRPRLQHRHFPIKTGYKQSRCWLCARRKVTARTTWKCMECNVNLCIENCFMQYHTE